MFVFVTVVTVVAVVAINYFIKFKEIEKVVP